jgi:hypothetical protein
MIGPGSADGRGSPEKLRFVAPVVTPMPGASMLAIDAACRPLI